MRQRFFVILIVLFMPFCAVFAHDSQIPQKPQIKELRAIDKMLEQKLNLSDEQIKYLKANKQKNIKELEKTIAKMENLHIKIRNIYLLGIPKYQADIKSAPYKMELVLLKQNADNIRALNRRNFESILTPEQKVEFDAIKQELRLTKH